jgi:hypothetical protein
MSAERDVWADVVLAVVGELDRLCGRVSAVDGWSSPAAHVGWSCWETVEHIAGDFAHYAGQVVASPRDHYVAFGFDTSRATTAAELVEVLTAAGRMLSAAVRTGDPASHGWHPHGMFSPTGFAAIGAAEGLVHGSDIAAGLDIAWHPPVRLTEQVLTTVFPDADHPSGTAAINTLLACTGRGPHATANWTYSAAALHPTQP